LNKPQVPFALAIVLAAFMFTLAPFASADFYICPAECMADQSCVIDSFYCPEACYYGDLHPNICHPRFTCPPSACPYLSPNPWAR